ncbi:MAG: 4-(cytidine 5'-diphospho)-2-C-methyl-D-erythritol kinase [Pirellulales bacterium]
MNIIRLATGVLVRAPAKLNLFFEVLAKRSDGFHEVETLMAPISLCDTLVATPGPAGSLTVACRWAAPGDGAQLASACGPLPDEKDNLAFRAVALLRARAGCQQGLHIELLKRIPSTAGLGGGSSDAAAALVAANEVWNLGWSRAALAELAAELGSDVPFFLYPGAAICRGRGERVEPVAGLGRLDFVLVRPPEGLSTAAVYSRWRVADRPRRVEPAVAALALGDLRLLRGAMHNQLEAAAESLSPWVGRLRQELAAAGCGAVQLSGSGSAYFGVCHHARHARRIAQRLRTRGIGQVFAVSTSK